MAEWEKAAVIDQSVATEDWQNAPVVGEEESAMGTSPDAKEEGEKAKKALSLAVEHNLPVETTQKFFDTFDGASMQAAPEPSLIGKLFSKTREYITEKTGLFAPDISPIGGREYREEHKLKTAARGAAYLGAATASGLSLTALDVLANKTTGDKTLAALVARHTGFEPTPREEQAAAGAEYMAEFTPVGAGVGAFMEAIPARQALKTILGAGLTFKSVAAANEFGKSITENRPVNWDTINVAGGIGVLFGTGEVVVAAALNGLLPAMDKAFESANAVEKAQVRADAVAAREYYRKNGVMPPEIMEKYVYGGVKPVAGKAVERGLALPTEAPTTVAKPSGLPPEAITPAEPTVPAPKAGMAGGFANIEPLETMTGIIADEVATDVKIQGKFWKNVPTSIQRFADQAPKFIETQYGEAGKQLAKDARTIAFESRSLYSKSNRTVKDALKGLTNDEIEAVLLRGWAGDIAYEPPKTITGKKYIPVKGNVKLTKAFLTLKDNQDFLRQLASDAGYKVRIGKVMMPIEFAGKWMPQRFNKKGIEILRAADKEGLGNPFVRKWAKRLVKDGKADTLEEALGHIVSWNNARLTNVVGNIQRIRTYIDLPVELLDLSPSVLLDTNRRVSMAIAAANQWGLPQTEGDLDFAKARELVAQIQAKHGKANADAVKVWIQNNFGGMGSGVPPDVASSLDNIRKYQSFVRIGLKIPQVIRHSPISQGFANNFDMPWVSQAKTVYQYLARAWDKQAAKLYRDMKDLVVGQYPEMAALQDKQSKIYKLALTPIRTAVEQSQIYSAMLGRNAVERWIYELDRNQTCGVLRQLWDKAANLTADPEGYFKGLITKYGGVNPLSDEELDDLLNRGAGGLTPDELDRIAYNLSVRKNFTMGIETNPLMWKTNPFVRVGLLFKTFPINYSRLVWEDAVKQGVKGNFQPFMKYLIHATLAGEIWLLVNDALKGGDKSTVSMLLNRPEKRHLWPIAKNLGYDWWVGGTGGIGMLVDMFNGRIDPISGTASNIKEAFGNWQHPIDALQNLASKEIGSIKEVQGLMERGKEIINGDTKYFDYRRWRDRGWEWARQKKAPTVAQQITNYFKNPEYEVNLQYKYATQCILAGDSDAAAKYLAEHLRDAPDRNNAIEGIKTAMANHSPLGHVATKDRNDFLDQFTPQEQDAARDLQQKWNDESRDAISKAKEMTQE